MKIMHQFNTFVLLTINKAHTNTWVYVGDLPAPRAVTTAAVLSPILVIGGWDGNERVKTAYRGTLTITLPLRESQGCVY